MIFKWNPQETYASKMPLTPRFDARESEIMRISKTLVWHLHLYIPSSWAHKNHWNQHKKFYNAVDHTKSYQTYHTQCCPPSCHQLWQASPEHHCGLQTTDQSPARTPVLNSQIIEKLFSKSTWLVVSFSALPSTDLNWNLSHAYMFSLYRYWQFWPNLTYFGREDQELSLTSALLQPS